MSKKLQCQACGRAEYGEDLYNYDGKILCRYCIVARVCESPISCEYVGTCNDRTFPNKTEQIDQLKQQLVEKEKELAYMTKQAKKFNHEAQKYYEDAYCNSFQNQKAIAELEKVKMLIEWKFNSIVEVREYLQQQIKGLKGE